MDAVAPPRHTTVNLSQKSSAATTKPSTKPRTGAANVKPGAAKPLAKPNPSVSKPAGAPKPAPSATAQMGPAQLDAIHRRAIQSIEGIGKVMSTARANVEAAKSSKEDQNKVVAKANEVAGALLAPSRHVASLLNGLGALFPPCKQVGNSLAALIKHEIGQPEKDVRVAIVHSDLAGALIHIGSLNRKSRPTKSLGDPLNESLKNFKGLIQEFHQFCEAYYKTRAPESSLQHLLHWKSNKDSLNGFADRIAQLKKGLTSVLSQQAVQHPGEHTAALAQIESRLAENRAFYATIRDANEEIAEAFLSNQGGQASARLVHDGQLLKQLAGVVGEGLTQGIASALKNTTMTSLKQVVKNLPDKNQQTTQHGVKGSFASKLQGTLGKLMSGSQQKAQVDTKSGSRGPHEHIHKQATSTHVPTPGHHSSHQQTKGNGNRIQTSRSLDQPFADTITYQEDVWYQDDEGNITEVFEGAVDQSGTWEGTDERESGYESLDVVEYEYADGEGDDDDGQVVSYLQEDEETGNGLEREGEYEYEEAYVQEDGDEVEEQETVEYEEVYVKENGDEEEVQEVETVEYEEVYVQEDGDEEEVQEVETVEYEEVCVQEDGDEEEGQEVETIEYAVSELAQPGGDDEGEQEPYYPEDDGDGDDVDADTDSGQGEDSEEEDGPDYYEDD